MAGVRGRRKAMLLIGEGVDYNIFEATGVLGSTASSVLLDTQDAIASATRGNVSIYAIDPRGLTVGDEDLITQSSTVGDANIQSLQSELRLSQDSLRVLATRPADSPPSTATISTAPSTASSLRTAATTCSAITR